MNSNVAVRAERERVLAVNPVVVEAFIASIDRRAAPRDAAQTRQVFQQALEAVRIRAL